MYRAREESSFTLRCCWGGDTSWKHRGLCCNYNTIKKAEWNRGDSCCWLGSLRRSHSGADSHLLTAHKLQCHQKKKEDAFHLSSLLFAVFLSDGGICSLLLQALCMFSYAPFPLHTHCQIGAFVHCTWGGESESLKEVYTTLCRSYSKAGKRVKNK